MRWRTDVAFSLLCGIQTLNTRVTQKQRRTSGSGDRATKAGSVPAECDDKGMKMPRQTIICTLFLVSQRSRDSWGEKDSPAEARGGICEPPYESAGGGIQSFRRASVLNC